MGSMEVNGAFIDEGEFKNFEMDLIIPSQHSSILEYMERFLHIDVNSFLQSSRDFVVQGELLKLFLVLQAPTHGPPIKLAPKPKDDINSQPNIGYHVDVRMRNPEDFTKTHASPHSSAKIISKTIMISNPKHGHVRHTPKLDSEYDTETGGDADTACSSGSDATSTFTATSTATTVTTATITNNNNTNNNGEEQQAKGPLSDFVAINSPAIATKTKNGNKPNFFRLPDGTIIFPIEIPVGIKSKYNNKDISVVVSVARVMQPPAGGVGNGGKLFGDTIGSIPLAGGTPGMSHQQQHITSATKLEKLLSTQYPQYWQYSQYSRGGVGNALPPPPVSEASKLPLHNSHSNPNLVGLNAPSLTRTPSTLNPSTPSSTTPPSGLSLSLSPFTNTLSNINSRSDPNIASLGGSDPDLLLATSSSSLLTPSSSMISRGSSGNLYGMGQLQTSTSSSNINFSNPPTGGTVGGGGGALLTSTASSANFNTNFGVSSGAPVAIKTAQKIVRVLEPLQVRLLQHLSPSSLKMGTKRLIPVAVSNSHPTLPITVRALQLVLTNIPSLEGGGSGLAGPGPDIPVHHVSISDKFKTSTLDIETFPVSVVPGDEYHFVVALEPQSSSPLSAPTPPPPTTSARASMHAGISGAKRRVVHTVQAQLVITWSIPCSPGSIISIHPLPVSFPAHHDLLVSFDSKSPVRAHNVFNVCFTITNLSDYSRDLTFIIPRPVCVTTSPSSSSSSISISTSTSSLTAPGAPSRAPLAPPRSPPTRSTTLPTIRVSSASTTSLPSVAITPTASPAPSRTTTSSVHPSASMPTFMPTPSIPTHLPTPSGPAPSSPLPQIPTSTRACVLANDTSIDENELISCFGELQANSASMLCLEKTLYVGLVKSNSSVSVNVRYIPLREGLFEIQGLQIFDRATDQVYVVQDTCQLYVIA